MNHYHFLTSMFGLSKPDEAISAHVVCVTPEKAKEILALNFNRNRSTTKRHIDEFKRAIDKDFFVTGSSFRIVCEKGEYVLTDGQHRLEAIAQSDKSVTMVLVIADGDAAQDYARIDQVVRKRTITDSLDSLVGVEYVESVMMRRYYHAAVRVIHGNFNIAAKRNVALPNELAKTVIEYESQMQFLTSFLLTRSRGNRDMVGVYRAYVLATALVTAKYANADIVKEFWYQVQADDGLRVNDPRKKLHNLLTEKNPRTRLNDSSGLIASIKCWNAFVAGQSLDKIYTSGKIPAIALTPFPLSGE